MPTTHDARGPVSRRSFLAATAGAAAALSARKASAASAPPRPDVPPEDFRIQNGRIKQSVYGWCFSPMPMEKLIDACHRMGVPAMDVGPEHHARLRELGMKPAMVGSHGFTKGPVSRSNHLFCIERLRAGIDQAVECGTRKVMTFTGMREKGVSDQQAAQNCVDCWKQVIGYAEQKGVSLCMEMLNTRDDSHPMKGHPGYFGDDFDLCIDLIKRVGSPRMTLLFDVYHIQIMNGDIIRRIRQYKQHIGHYHVAGVPGRGEMDDTQEINYPAVLRAILETGYDGFVSLEFIPTWEDKLAALRWCVRACDI